MTEPHDNEAEKALLGAILSDSAVLPRVRGSLGAGDFYAPGHAKIFDALLSLFADGQAVDHLTLADRLQQRGHLKAVGGPAYLMALDSQVPMAANAPQYAEIIRDRAVRRKLLAIGRRLQDVAVDLEQQPGEVQTKAARALAGIHSGTYRLRTLTEIMQTIYEELGAVQDGAKVPVIPTGIRALDKVIGGLQDTLIVIGARTGVGKSAVGSTIVQNVAQRFAEEGLGHKFGVFSLEDEAEWLGYRYLAQASTVNGFILRYRKKTDAQWTQIGDGTRHVRTYSDQILVDDRADLASWEIAQAADDMVLNHGVRALLVDHLQEVNHWAHKLDTLEQNMTRSLMDLRGISKRHGIPVVVLCQMREDEKVKPGQFQGAAGFYGAKETVKKSRIALELAREDGSNKMGIRVLKQTNGIGQRDVEVEFVNGAAMIRDLEGEQGDLLEQEEEPARERARGGFTHDPDRESA